MYTVVLFWNVSCSEMWSKKSTRSSHRKLSHNWAKCYRYRTFSSIQLIYVVQTCTRLCSVRKEYLYTVPSKKKQKTIHFTFRTGPPWCHGDKIEVFDQPNTRGWNVAGVVHNCNWPPHGTTCLLQKHSLPCINAPGGKVKFVNFIKQYNIHKRLKSNSKKWQRTYSQQKRSAITVSVWCATYLTLGCEK